MKKTLLFIIFLLIAFLCAGQSDSVTISLVRANQIEKTLTDCDLVKLQYTYLVEAEQMQRVKVSSLTMLNKIERNKFELAEKELRKKERWNTFFKIALPVAVVVALLI